MLRSAFFGEVRKAAFGLCTNRFRCLKRILNILGLLQHVWLTVLSHATEHVSQSEHTTLTNPGSRVNPHKRANNGSSEFAPSSMCTCTRAVTRIQSIFSVLLATHCGMFYGRLLSVSYHPQKCVNVSFHTTRDHSNPAHGIIFAKSRTSIVKLVGLMSPLKIKHLFQSTIYTLSKYRNIKCFFCSDRISNAFKQTANWHSLSIQD